MEGCRPMTRVRRRIKPVSFGTPLLRRVSISLFVACLLLTSTPLFAATSSDEQQLAMRLTGDGIEFATNTIDNVYARVHISDVRKDMKKLKSAKTHLMAVRFFNAENDEPLPQGFAAVYLKNDHDKAGFFDPMKNRDGIFVAGLLMIKPGQQQVIIASKLLDRKTRDFQFHFTLVK